MHYPKGQFHSLPSPGSGGRLPRLVLISFIAVVALLMGSPSSRQEDRVPHRRRLRARPF